jgi:hypothetical protein
MNQWAFVVAAYGVTFAGTGGLLLWAWFSCRRDEAAAERLGRRQ